MHGTTGTGNNYIQIYVQVQSILNHWKGPNIHITHSYMREEAAEAINRIWFLDFSILPLDM